MNKCDEIVANAYKRMYGKRVNESLITETGPLELSIALDFEKSRGDLAGTVAPTWAELKKYMYDEFEVNIDNPKENDLLNYKKYFDLLLTNYNTPN